MSGRAPRRRVWRLAALVAALLLAAGAASYRWYAADIPQRFDDPVQQFKYGSTGGDRLAGIPLGIFRALPALCRDYLPGEGWESLGFLYEPGTDRPVGTSLRRTLGFERVSLNCATCHVGTYRTEAGAPPVMVPGMPANQLDLVGFARFLGNCALDERFNPWQVIQAAEEAGARYNPVERLLLQYVAVPALKEGVILARFRLRFLGQEVEAGPGRFDTFGPLKALLNWPLELLPARQRVGIVDFPSLWLQAPRQGMHLHWDGNNDSVEERNRSAGFGTGAVPALADDASLAAIAAWLRTPRNVPPPWPFPVDPARAARGAALYAGLCAGCHGASGRDFSGARVGQVEPIEAIRTDPCRLDNYTAALAEEQGNLYAAYPDKRFTHFRKTHGYANAPLDGLWLRAPYLHNGSVPTLRDLLEPAERRPAAFWRGNDLLDRDRLGFVSDMAEVEGRRFFRYETRCTGDAALCAREANPENRHDDNRCPAGRWAGNSNRGHDGPAYGTDLPASDKDALVEFLKTF
ncbi:cytochrome c [Roseomonas sp. M0104]|uniref:Cytochrome c n=1 Tax=Teichococcus coralli TaxID=2545983 RepID=A0A845BPK6_9PROT|nr:cytochrome c [Pseudoroseomonas coralli]MXP65339.1 cytochrome c [Pseudoroseomonas coralli]